MTVSYGQQVRNFNTVISTFKFEHYILFNTYDANFPYELTISSTQTNAKKRQSSPEIGYTPLNDRVAAMLWPFNMNLIQMEYGAIK
ncbi:hypothetical protein [Paenibacillus uliginis]|uniref:hypothetical protein n=1 Tax=Paenibacillus uliginis TaxID=683737 RepID=UPI001AECC9FD|nr:hypothetical protein [Paenibacillus uliginis]